MDEPASAGRRAGSAPLASSSGKSTNPINPSLPGSPASASFPADTEIGQTNASRAASSLASDATEAARKGTRAVQDQTAQLAQNVGHELKKTAEDQKMRGVEAIQSFARAMNNAAEELDHQSPGVAKSVRDAAQKIDGLSKNISNRNVDELFAAASEAARTQPMLFIGGAVAAGFALARFFKSSASHRGTAGPTVTHT